MESIFLLKFVHVLGASVLFGTGLGIAYFMFMAHRTGHAGVIAVTARFVILADLIFTATAVVVQPVSGVLLAWSIGLSPLEESWIVLSLLLYVLVGLCWLPAVFIQIRMRKLAHDAAVNSKPLPDGYRRLFRIWFALGWPAFAGVHRHFCADDLATAMVVSCRRGLAGTSAVVIAKSQRVRPEVAGPMTGSATKRSKNLFREDWIA